MHLKALTLRGFKSFASATTLRFEPGITCVVGPNGSGKSNVVDALSWVMGEQGAKSLRGGKMEDVIFAGTTGRPPLGRAEVSLTIDNSDGALPIEYSEVTITRIMFRNGGSEYQINGDTCRLLDIQELLSDSGIGREMHVIVGQGQLDSVLHADPMGRRAFIEEAAGVLKHRKRKEKALRKLDAMQANLARVQDLTDELRRQLKPLGRQAAVARRAAVIQADLRDARLRLLADDLVTLREALQAEIADEAALKQRKEAAEAELKKALQREGLLEDEVRRLTPRLQNAQQTWYELSQLAERVRGTISLADARVKSATSAPPRSGAAGTPRTWSARPPASASRRPNWRPPSKRPNARWRTPSPTAPNWSAIWPRRNGGSRTSPVPSPTGAKGSPGSRDRWAPPAPAQPPPRPRSNASPPPATRRGSAPWPPRRSTRPSGRRSTASTRATRSSPSGTRKPSAGSPRQRPSSPPPARPSPPWRGNAPRPRHATRPWRSACAARTAPARCSARGTASPGCSDRPRNC